MSKRHYSAVDENDELLTALTCSICLDYYKLPKNLPSCSHTFCFSCLDTVVRNAVDPLWIHCPNCRTRNVVPSDGAQGFPTNGVALQLCQKLDLELFAEDDPAVVASDVEDRREKCKHIFSSHRTTCVHCSKRFCDRCLETHLRLVRQIVVDMSDSISKRMLAIDVEPYDAEVFNQVAKIKEQLKSRSVAINAAVKAECDRVSAEADYIAGCEVDKFRSALLDCRISIQKHLAQIREVEGTSVSQAHELFFAYEKAKKSEKMVDNFEKQVSSKTFVELLLHADTAELTEVISKWTVTAERKHHSATVGPCKAGAGSSPQNNTENQEKNEETLEQKAAQLRCYYDDMAAVATGVMKDAFGGNIRLPRRICAVGRDKVAVVHEMNCISIYQHNGRIAQTLKMFDPRKSKAALFVNDLAFYTDSRLIYLVADSGTVIVSFSLTSTSCTRMPECVFPAIFVCRGPFPFQGIAICSAKKELYTGEAHGIAVYSTNDQTRLFVVPTNGTNIEVLNCFGDISCHIYFCVNSGDELGRVDRNNYSCVEMFARRGSALGEVRQVSGVSFDETGNILVSEAKNNRIQIFLADTTALATFSYQAAQSKGFSDSQSENYASQSKKLKIQSTSATASRPKPFGISTIWPDGGNKMRIVVPDYASHRVFFLESQ